jgi:hypothetical protein
MKPSLELFLAIYGALLSTVLGVLAILKFFWERPRLLVDAVTVSASAKEGEDTHGVLVPTNGMGSEILWESIDVEIRVRNSGGQACQIIDVFVEHARVIHHVRPSNLPAIIDPYTTLSVRVQPEYFAPKSVMSGGHLRDLPVEAVGVSDGLGRRHEISTENLEMLMARCRALPLRTRAVRHKETGKLAVTFQVKDSETIAYKNETS